MSAVLSLLLSVTSCTLLWGMPFPPQNVTLVAKNFHTCLMWEPDPHSPSSARYQVEWKSRRTSPWTKADTCWGNSSSSSWTCELYFEDIHDIYWARVRAVDGDKLSKWVSSSELQPYRDTVVGPPELSWLLQGHILSIKIIMPLTPYQSKNGSYKPINKVLRKLWYRLNLYEKDVFIQQVPCEQRGKEASCMFRYLKPSTQYCVRTVTVGMPREQSREAAQCITTSATPGDFPWVLLAVLSAVLLVLFVAGLCFLRLYVFLRPSETRIPNSLAILNEELTLNIRVPTLELEGDSSTLISLVVLPSHGSSAAEQKKPQVQLFFGESFSQEMAGYCANGFRPDWPESEALSFAPSQLEHVLDSGASSPLEGLEEGREGDDVSALPAQLPSGSWACLEQPVLVELNDDSYRGDEDYQTSEMWLSLHLQLYSKCQCPLLGTGSSISLTPQGTSFSQEDLKESLGMTEPCCQSWVPLSSVKLPADEEDRDQLFPALCHLHGHGAKPELGDRDTQQSDLDQATLGWQGVPLPSSCEVPYSPLDILQATTSSGYEIHPLVTDEP
ncbi:interleukin-20 receptor subunit alpha-like isoform X3 [Apteryx mantelli]|uniref:Interleukin-20 receptor subunit alpha-like isoform X2 n=1 Tax=Apteryx mantelli TaxID=2696672 RepID=A0A8B7JS21_9AVES|nr:PREDICTED: interleukin-20 receptor subunit alpha-like isoform X2 [Apteryx mantelli mantelli]XP_013813804.1 PREDICTED: interleukin-20 receptor subunit alpha-like isoform X2 [Apteryx mantelli mantelli]XP_013813805.1 PREDICTED: interleukin-20 receptor subunit alpha-like isoform X2 [Apteryx mantelli mantelli]XP_013813806.1 PREDICTED: interleukin-20 receptor subunit alpha-like isoform X2 [Apteryx mantelli mantelli]XP_025947208.1 interleukin-20 receptor subunit alpha-like isoform X2 [Apteryx rowi]